MIALDHRDRAARPEKRVQAPEGEDRVREVFENETDEDVIETLLRKRESEEVALPERDIRDPCCPDPLFCSFHGVGRDIDRGYVRPGAVPCEDYRLGADAAAGFEEFSSLRVARVVVEEICQGPGLVREPVGFAGGVPVDIAVFCHERSIYRDRSIPGGFGAGWRPMYKNVLGGREKRSGPPSPIARLHRQRPDGIMAGTGRSPFIYPDRNKNEEVIEILSLPSLPRSTIV